MRLARIMRERRMMARVAVLRVYLGKIRDQTTEIALRTD
jgi:hypothetical protein